MSKSSKRIKLENEIFSKSIKDIELMFNFSYDQENYTDTKRKVSKSEAAAPTQTARLEQKIPKVQLDLPTGLGVRHIEVDYDCINMSFLSDSSDTDKDAFVLAPSHFTSHPVPQLAPKDSSATFILRNQGTAAPPNVLMDFNDDDEIDDYSFGSDLKHYMPRMNLESDLKRIDQMFAAPSLLTKFS